MIDNSIPKSRRQLIAERDGYRCAHCGTTSRLEVDHIVPRAKYGADTLDNLQLLCKTCNLRKGTKSDPYKKGAYSDEYYQKMYEKHEIVRGREGVIKGRYKAVKHPILGYGNVIDVIQRRDDYEVVVSFIGSGVKSFALSLMFMLEFIE